jgi:hypothetical protein
MQTLVSDATVIPDGVYCFLNMAKLQITVNLGNGAGKTSENKAPGKADDGVQIVKKKNHRKKKLVIAIIGLLVLASGATFLFRAYQLRPQDPFTTKIQSSVHYPLYYPTQLPTGFRMGQNSVVKPQANVVLVTIDGPRNEKLYISEEAIPSGFSFNGFYLTFADLKKINTPDGLLAIGRINARETEIGSLATAKTWILSNTNSPVSNQQLTAMMQSLTLAKSR